MFNLLVMEFLEQLLINNQINWQTATLRILLSFFIGTIIGFEREAHNQPAGLRTHILISIGATIIMLLSIYIPQTFTNAANGDPGRIAAQVVSGIGFLGAGAILKFGGNVKGLTTAASIWAIAALGLAVGAGMYIISAIGAVVILFALTVMDVFEKVLFKEKLYKKIVILVKKRYSDINHFQKVLEKLKVKVSSAGFESNSVEANNKIMFIIAIPVIYNLQLLAEELEKTEGVVAVSIEILS